jgi:eukaryotic-like serine/threonine-protein kinase
MPSFFDSESAGHPAKGVSELGEQTNFAVPEKPLVLQGRYAIIKPLGQGGMGTVFLAQDKRLSNRFCVVKKLRLDGFDSEDKHKATTFFEREAMILSSLKHPNVVAIQDYFQEHGNYFLVMEYVKGDNLQQLLKKRGEPFSEKQVISWALAILNVLHYLHSHKPPVMYRDIKPSNIMLSTTDGIKLVDFGIARPYAEHSENTHVVSGGYSPPEQYWGGADLRSDIYALGATMYYLLTGKEPLALLTCSTRRAKVPVSDHLDKIIQRATAQDVWLRYQTAEEMQQVLSEVPDKVKTALFPSYVLVAGVLALVSVACAAFIFFAFTNKDGHFHDEAVTLLSKNQNVENNAKRESALWHIPFEIATLASNEDVITDPDQLQPDNLSMKQNPFKKK